MIELHPRLAEDCIHLGHFPLCQLLLMNDANYPWFILVPNRHDVTEIHQLEHADRIQLIEESCYLNEVLTKQFDADKMNIAALGNIVPQLHIHHIVRYQDDISWPSPVWGARPAVPYDDAGIEDVLSRLRSGLTRDFIFDSSIDPDAETEG